MDYNEDRLLNIDKTIKTKKLGLASSVVETDQSNHAFIYLDTLGMYNV